MKKQKVITALNELKLKPRMSSNQKTDMLIELKRENLQKSELKWTNESDGHKATEIIMDKKLDEEIFFRSCLRKKVILYDNKDFMEKNIQKFIKTMK